jgi:hypothetical protein
VPVPPAAARHDVGTLGELRLGQFTAARRVVPGRAGGPGHVAEHLGLGIGELGALLVAALELADQRDVHAADKTDLAGLAGHGGHHADQEAAFLLLEHDRLHVGQLDHHVDDAELELGEFLGDLLDGGGLTEAHGDDGAGALLGHASHRLLALRFVGYLELQVFLPVSFFQRSMPL